MKLTYRSPSKADCEILFSLYEQTRADEVSQFGWPAEQQRAFLEMQFRQREAAYKLQFPQAETKIIVENDQIAGSMTVEFSSSGISLIDVALFPDFQRKGIGSAVVGGLQAQAKKLAVPIILHVDRYNSGALRFYLSKGFEITDQSQINYTLKWNSAITKE